MARQVWFALSDILGDDLTHDASIHWKQMTRRHAAIRRLLLVEAAIREFRIRHERLPESLTELKLPDSATTDPHTTDQEPLHYRLTDSGYELYGIGTDGEDNGGVPIPDNSHVGDGDYVLDSLFPQN